jgi:hypothetical protein
LRALRRQVDLFMLERQCRTALKGDTAG